MKKLFLTIVISIYSFSIQAYEITNCLDLESIGKGENYLGATHTDAWPLDGEYFLINDIDCQNNNFNQIAPDADNPFTGKMNGQNFTISNIFGANGLFGYMLAAEVSNLNIKNVVIKSNTTNQGVLFKYAEIPTLKDININNSTVENLGDNNGILGGRLLADSGISKISNIFITQSNVMGLDYNGGFVGSLNGLVNYIYLRNIAINGSEYTAGIAGYYGYVGDVVGYFSVQNSLISGTNYVGGIFGKFTGDGLKFMESNKNSISGNNFVGGIAGWSDSFSNDNAYSTSKVSSVNGDMVGGLYGYLDSPTNYQGIYFTRDLSSSITAQNSGRIVGNSVELSEFSAFYYENQLYSAPTDNLIDAIQPASSEDFSNKDWYINTLGFSENYWMFPTTLSIFSGPTLK